jgi:anti-sigma regulatory factor (Ser/Thr protein kinase)
VHGSDGGDLEQVCQAHAEVFGLAAPAETFTEDFSADPAAASAARRLVARALDGGCERSVSDTAQLIASELATNAIRHARSEFRLTVRRDRYRVRLEVSDRSVARPVARTPSLGDTSGWGLRIIDVLAAGWGVDAEPAGKTVWVELDL